MSVSETIKCETRSEYVTLTVNGIEIVARVGEMLLDAAKKGDVEIPYFCYESKLGAPVGACRMCLVEIEGIPKLQTSCSTPVKDGMVATTMSARVKEAHRSVVEFILLNHPLDCPVCDKGGECPLQDVTMGWGPGKSRTTEPKRHFVKPVRLSPLIAIDRERCILCYRCVRYSQEVSEDYQLVFLGRGAGTFVGTFDGSEYVAPFSGNVIELCPVGALTSTEYRFRARPWEIESSSSICTLCPAQCNINFTIRDERVERVLARDEAGNPGVDNGWLCDKGRFAYRAINAGERVTEPLVRIDGSLEPAGWDRALDAVANGLKSAAPKVAALAGGETTNEEGFLLQALMREALGSSNVDARSDGKTDPDLARLLSRPELQATVTDLDDAEVILVIEADPMNEMAILDLRIRKAVRHGKAKLAVATGAPGALDGIALECIRHHPGTAEALLAGLVKALLDLGKVGALAMADELPGYDELKSSLEESKPGELAARSGTNVQQLRDLANLLAESASTVIVWGERAGHGPRGARALENLANLALLLRLDSDEGFGLLEVPVGANGRGLREVGCLPNMGPGLSNEPDQGLSAEEIGRAAAANELDAVYLLHSDPLREHPVLDTWREGLKDPTFVVVQTQFISEELARYADVVIPAEAYAEKQGTVTHPDGRIQRLRSAVPRPGRVRMEWQVLAEIGERLGWGRRFQTASSVFAAIADAVPFYGKVVLEDTSRLGVRWQEKASASRGPAADIAFSPQEEPPALKRPAGDKLLLGSSRSLWASVEIEHSESLKFLSQKQRLLLAPKDATKLGIGHGDRVEVRCNGSLLETKAALAAVREGSALLIEGTGEDPASTLVGSVPQPAKVKRVDP